MKVSSLFLLYFLILGASVCSFAQKDTTSGKRPLIPSTAQGTASSLLSYEVQTDVFSLLPPNVAFKEQYGNLQANYNTGQLNHEISLYNINVDNNLSIPVQLAYHNTGLQPAKVPTWVGNGWDLTVGGNVVQYVKGTDDFAATGLQNGQVRQELQQYMTGGMTTSQKYNYSRDVSEGLKDSQFDSFSFNLMGRVGKFYFDGSNVVFYNYLPLKVSFSSNQFAITDETGIVYTFSLVIDATGSFSDEFITGNTDPFIVSTRTWYLTKITTTSGVEAIFNYTPDIAYEISATNTSYSAGAKFAFGACSYSGSFSYAGQTMNATVGQYLLSEVLWKDKKVSFETIPRNDLTDPNSNKAKALSKIKVFDENNSLTKQIGFEYGYMNNNDRLQLQNVSVLDKNTGDKVEIHSFEYFPSAFSVPIPALKTPTGINPDNHSIDHWGYFNGKPNTSKVPRANYLAMVPNASIEFGDANRAPDGNASKAGMLTKITYPTQGRTEIGYEPNVVHFDTHSQVPFFMQNQEATGYSLFFDSGNRDCNTGGSTGQFTLSAPMTGAKINWTLETNSPDDVSWLKLTLNGTDIINKTQTGQLKTDLAAGTYTYSAEPGCVSQSGSVVALALFKIERPVTPSGQGIDLEVGGNRVALIVDYDPDLNSNFRRIRYNDSFLTDIPYYVSTFEAGGGAGGTINSCVSCGTTYVLNSNNVYNWDGFHVQYLNATEELGFAASNGKKVYTYAPTYYAGTPYQSPYPATKNLSWRSGNLTKMDTYRKEATGFELLEEIEKTYIPWNLATLITANSIKIGKRLNCPVGTAPVPDTDLNYDAGLVSEISDKFGLASDIKTYHAEGLSTTTTQTYDYNADWLLSKTTTQNSKGQSIETKIYYANDYNNAANNTIANLKNIHAIGIPLKTTKTLNNQIIDGALVKTDAVGNPVERYAYQIAGGTHLHNPAVFITPDFYLSETRRYSTKGNLTEVIPKSGIAQTYLWGYKHSYPVAEIQNATQNEVETLIGSMETAADMYQDNDVLNANNTLRANLPNAFVRSGVMVSGVGFKNLTTTNALTTSYQYDALNRLVAIADPQNFETQRFDYHYANQPLAGGISTLSGNRNFVLSRVARTAQTTLGTQLGSVQSVVKYIDGLGRPVQEVHYGASPDQSHDIVAATTLYDDNARPTSRFLDFPSNSNTGAFEASSLASDFYADAVPYQRTFFENSPANRPQREFGVGEAWLNKAKQMQYLLNTANEIPMFEAGTGKIERNGYYATGALTKTVSIDEQDHRQVVYTDKEGRTVQKSIQESANTYLHTAYVYNNYGQLSYVLPPELYAQFTGTELSESAAAFEALAFGYRYDARGRLVEKQVPGAGWTYFVYDHADRPVLEQNSRDRTQNLWRFSKYDATGRIIMTGVTTQNQTRSQLQGLFDSHTLYYETRNATPPLYYSLNGSFPFAVQEAEVRSVVFYDSYTDWLPANMAFETANAYHSQHPNAKSLATGSRLRHSENQNWLTAASYYDYKNRPIQTFAQNLYGQTERTDIEYNFAGEILKQRQIHTPSSGAGGLVQLTEYDYDHVGRKTACYQTINGGTREKIASYSYDAVGRLSQKKIMPDGNYTTGGTPASIVRPPNPSANTNDIATQFISLQPGVLIDPANLGTYLAQIGTGGGGTSINGLQKIDYNWHIRGGLRGINLDNGQNPTPNTGEADLFSYKLDYETAGFYDGNIGKQSWSVAPPSGGQTGLAGGAVVRSYTFNYDPTKRLKSATYTGINGENYSLPNMSYDRNGNITNLQRNGKTGSGFGQIDNLSYSYNGNRLSQITDGVGGNHDVDFVQRGGANYTFYNDGSLKSDANEQIQNINYDTFLQQPTQVQLTDGRTINYYYDGGGKLLKTVYSTGETWEFGNGMIYKNGQSYQMNMPEGRAIFANGTWQKEFHYQDHLGNTRVSFRANGNQLEKVSETAFDPWGVILNGIGQQNAFQNRFEMQGKESEKTFGLNRINFGARTYNSTTVVWDRIDVMAEEYFGISPYVYVLNRPTVAIDPDGRRVYFIGGAGNDSDGWNYIKRWGQAFRNAGINDFIRVNASHGKAGDVAFTNFYRSSGMEADYTLKSAPAGGGLYGEYNGEVPVNNQMTNSTAKLYKQQLKDNPLEEGEQFNLAGYSYGSVLQAQAALKLANDGQVIDNLVLIGSPISDKSDLWKQLNSNKNIKNVVRYDIKGDLLSNPQDVWDFIKGGIQNSNDAGPHFDAARPGQQTNQLIQTIVQWLQQQGVKN